jgi:hypothetical protein
MARQRTVKPGFFSNEDLAACAPLTRIFFEGLWCWADREGRLADRPRRLKAEILPYDDADGEAMVAELAERGFLVRYEHGGVRLLQIVNFLKHQSPHPREVPSVLPDPDEVMPRQDPGTNKDKPSRGKPRKGTEEQRTSNAGVSGVSGKEEHAACARDGAAEQPESPGAGGGHRTGPQEGAAEANAASGGESPAASDGEGAPGAADRPDNGPRRTGALLPLAAAVQMRWPRAAAWHGLVTEAFPELSFARGAPAEALEAACESWPGGTAGLAVVSVEFARSRGVTPGSTAWFAKVLPDLPKPGASPKSSNDIRVGVAAPVPASRFVGGERELG